MAPAAKKSRGKSNANLWTKEKTFELIALYESYSDLWNISSPLYSNRTHKQKLLVEIGAKMETDAAEVAAKLHNLRCQYNGELRKMKTKMSGSGTDELYVPRWDFFCALKFLTNGGQSCSTTSNLQFEADISSEDVDMSGSESSLGVSPSPPASPEVGVTASGSYRKKKTDSKASLQRETLLNNAAKILGTPADSHQIFADYIADHLRNLTEAKQKRLKLLIQKAIIAVEEEPEQILIQSSVIAELPPISTEAFSQDMLADQSQQKEGYQNPFVEY